MEAAGAVVVKGATEIVDNITRLLESFETFAKKVW